MKKLILLSAMICAGQMHGMEVPKQEKMDPALWGNLPDDVKPLIIMALRGDTLEDAVNNIKKASVINTKLNQMVNEEYGNLDGFTKLVHILSNKFMVSTEKVASTFNTAIAKRYKDLGEKLLQVFIFLYKGNIINDTISLIEQGADVNYSKERRKPHPGEAIINNEGNIIFQIAPLPRAIRGAQDTLATPAQKRPIYLQAIQILLNAGAHIAPDEFYHTGWGPMENHPEVKKILDAARAERK